jgi:cytidyltransferase-related domain
MNDSAYLANPACQTDAEIGHYIASNPSRDFTGVLAADGRWPVFYHLGDLPAGLLCWYPFRSDASLLQIGGGFGVLTGMLCDRCKTVTVLEHDAYRAECIKRRWHQEKSLCVLTGDVSGLSADRFDYIVMVVDQDFIEPVFCKNDYITLLSHIKTLLADGGKLLFALPNRLGVKQLCGAPDTSTGIPFEGLNNYPAGAVMPALSRSELLKVLKQAGFPEVKLYYPFPDHLLPQMIYTDDFKPGTELSERLRPYQVNQESLVINPQNLYNDLASEDMLTSFFNAFLAECGDGNFSHVIFATVSPERGKEESFTTAITDHGTVEKYPIYAEGINGLERLKSNLSSLKSRGIPVIEFDIDGSRLVMPRISAPSLSKVLKELAAHDTAALIACLDRLYEYILQSSEHVPPECNALAGLNPDADWGPILARTYIEMIPVNCFYENDSFMFFDQEFVKENYPARYVMFRAIYDIYSMAPQTAKYIPRRVLQDRYGLTELWPLFWKKEVAFQDWLRRRKMYQHYYRWISPDKKSIRRNGRLLLMANKPPKIYMTNMQSPMFDAVGGAEGKTIVLFGAGRMMDHYLNKYKGMYPISFVVDNDQSKWNTEKLGYTIKSPQALKELDPGQLRVIICSKAYPEIAEQLLEVGISDFRIFDRITDAILETLEINQNPNEKYNIGYVTGVFDLFHIGHLNILQRSKERCEYLIAGVLTDEICIAEKGKKPVISFDERMEIVRHIDYVDRVVPVDYSNTNKFDAWRQLHYDCFFSGSDHEWYWLKKQLNSVGSNVEVFPYTQGTSSTELGAFIKKSL